MYSDYVRNQKNPKSLPSIAPLSTKTIFGAGRRGWTFCSDSTRTTIDFGMFEQVSCFVVESVPGSDLLDCVELRGHFAPTPLERPYNFPFPLSPQVSYIL